LIPVGAQPKKGNSVKVTQNDAVKEAA